jgi:hypothetical protein
MGRRPRYKINARTGEETSASTPAPSESKSHQESQDNSEKIPTVIPSRRFVLPMSDEKSVAWDQIPEKNLEILRDALKNPDTAKILGISKPEETPGEIGFSNDDANAFLDLLSGVDSLAASKVYKIPKTVTDAAFKFEDYHRKKLNPPMVRLLNKWSPLILKNWKDEIGFGIILVSTLNAQVNVMHALENKRRASLPRNDNITPISGATLERTPAPMPKAEAAKTNAPAPTPDKKPEVDILEAVGWD